MKKITIILLIFLISICISCNKFLDTKPTDFISPVNYYNTELQLNSALAGVYDRLGDFRMYGRGYMTYLAFSDEWYFKNSSTGINANIIDASTLDINRHWESLYTGIERANMLMDNIINAENNVPDSIIDEIKGQALFLRGYYYFLLVDEFGGVPLKLHSTTSPTEQPLPRSSVADIYAQIIKDIKDAIPLLKSATYYNYNGRISKTAAQGILARIYLTMAGAPLNDISKYSDAKLYSDSVIKSGIHSLNPSFSQIFINQMQDVEDIKESLWEVEFEGANTSVIREGGCVGVWNGIACANIDTGYGYDYVHATAKLYSAYDSTDLRRDWTISPYSFVTSGSTVKRNFWTSAQIYERSNGKWRREYETVLPRVKDYTNANWPILRYSDVLLMYAEADNQISGGPSSTDYEYLNEVRRRGYGKPISTANAAIDAPAGLSQNAFQTYIQNERLREFAFEGLRKHDLIRWGIYVSTMQQQATVYNATMPSALKAAAIGEASRVTDRSILFPIPNSELNVNHNITQNSGW